MNRPLLPNAYIEDHNHRMERIHLDDKTYEMAMRAMIIVCTDAVIINHQRQSIYLAKRATKPMKGLWWIGGRRLTGELPLASMNRCFKRETGLDLPDNRFTFVDTAEYIWKDREQDPQDAGSHNLVHTFAVELSTAELAQARRGLEEREYEHDFGLREFRRPDLVKAKAHQVILDVYDKIFS